MRDERPAALALPHCAPSRAQVDGAPTLKQVRSLAACGTAGFLHSEEAGSAMDGPGMRVVYWLTGCNFRCRYCHNPDTWKLRHGRLVEAREILDKLEKYKAFLALAGGGVTISGGEPLVQDRFVMTILRGAKALNIHTALDTNGFLGSRLSDEDIASVDLFLLDIKSWDAATHLRVTARALDPVLKFARRLATMKKPVWLRFVLVPGLTDAPANIDGVAGFAAALGNVERVEVMPFHQLGRFKWQQLGMKYDLDETRAPSAEETEAARRIFRARGLQCA